MFLRLHYTAEPGREFLVNVSSIAGVEINGNKYKGSVLTLTTLDTEGEQRYETVQESFDEICRWLNANGLLIN
jgi:hypothetical protein